MPQQLVAKVSGQTEFDLPQFMMESREEMNTLLPPFLSSSRVFAAGVYIFINSFRKGKKKNKRKPVKGNGYLHAFLLGLALKAINPAQFGFWIFWSTYLISNNLLKAESTHYTLFCLGLGSATFTGYALYVFFGEWLQTRSFFTKKRFDRVLGIVLCLVSLFWAGRMLWG